MLRAILLDHRADWSGVSR